MWVIFSSLHLPARLLLLWSSAFLTMGGVAGWSCTWDAFFLVAFPSSWKLPSFPGYWVKGTSNRKSKTGKMSLQLSFLLSSGSLQRTCALLFTLLGSQPLWLWYGHTVRNKFEPPRKRPPFQLKCLYRQNFNIDQVWTREILFLIKHTRPGNVLGFSSKAGADCLFHWRGSHLSLSWLASFIRISTKEIRKGPATWVPRMQQGLCMNKSFTRWGIKAFTYTFYKVGEIKIWILCCTQKSYMFDRKG